MRSFFLLVLACLSTVLGAFDRDFSVRGDGREAPRQLDVFRRGRGYVIALESREEAFVFLSCCGERRLVLDTEKEVFRIRAEKPVFVWYVPDRDSRFADQDIVGIDCRFKKGTIHLPGRNAFPLMVSGRKGRQYSWNDEEGTILEQVSNSRVCFQDASFDVIGPCCGDLIDGSAEAENGLLRLEARLREKADCDMRVLIDSVPDRGYIGDGADFLLNNHRLSRFSGENPNQWKWENFSTVKFEKEGNTYRWSLPLELIRAGGGGRLRLRFQSLCRSCRNSGGDHMPGHGKILPVLRPGNLAAEKSTVIEVSGIFPQYKIYPLTDGQTARRMFWSYESFAAAPTPLPRWVAFRFGRPRKVGQVIVWWDSPAKEPALQIMDTQGRWTDVPATFSEKGGERLPENDSETGAVVQQRRKPGKRDKSRLMLPPGTETCGVRLLERERSGTLWLREVEIY